VYVIKKAEVSKEDFNRLVFVLKARANNRENFSVLHAEELPGGTRLVATDGKRLHVAEVGMKLAGGDYTPRVLKDRVRLVPARGAKFPDWKRGVPEAPVGRGSINLAKTGIGGRYELSLGMSLAFQSLIQKTGAAVNIRYLEDLPKKEWQLLVPAGRRWPLMFRQKDSPREAYAVIAPVTAA
jgi:hypothetical protein